MEQQSTKTRCRCLVCHSEELTLWAKAKDLEYLTSDDEFSYYLCAKCDVLSIDPLPIDRLKEIYPDNYYSFVESDSSFVENIKEWLDGRYFSSILKKIKKQNINAIDIGGGTGWLLDQLKGVDGRISKTQVVDIDPDAEKIAKAKGHDYFCGRIEAFKSDEKFDFVLLLNLIEHVENPLLVLSKIQEILSPEGVILIKTPNFDSLDARYFQHKNWGGLHCPRHWVLFTKESFKALAQQAKFEVSDFSYTQSASFWTTSTLFWLAKKGLIKITKQKPAEEHPICPLLNVLYAGFDFMRAPFSKTSQMFFLLSHKKELSH